jgi:peptidyl-Lys metalloendopeptidase
MLSTQIFIFISSFIVLFSADTSALPSLSLRVHGPQIVYAVENLVLITNISNTGNETLKLLNNPQGPTSKTPTNKFDIRSSAGERPLFTGIEVNYDPFKAANTGDHDAFTVLAPGESISVEHDCRYSYVQDGSAGPDMTCSVRGVQFCTSRLGIIQL